MTSISSSILKLPVTVRKKSHHKNYCQEDPQNVLLKGPPRLRRGHRGESRGCKVMKGQDGDGKVVRTPSLTFVQFLAEKPRGRAGPYEKLVSCCILIFICKAGISDRADNRYILVPPSCGSQNFTHNYLGCMCLANAQGHHHGDSVVSDYVPRPLLPPNLGLCSSLEGFQEEEGLKERIPSM